MLKWFELDKRCKTRNGLLKLLTSNKLSEAEKKEVREKIKKINAKQCDEWKRAREAYDRIII
jgi:hypothetical protein